MEGSRKVERLSKEGRCVRYAQRHFVRCVSSESALEYEDSIEPVRGYSDHVKTAEPKQRKRPQPRIIRKQARAEQN